MRTFWKIKDEPCCVKPNQLLTSHSSSLTIPSLPANTRTLKQGPLHPTMAQKTNMAACLLAVAALVFWEVRQSRSQRPLAICAWTWEINLLLFSLPHTNSLVFRRTRPDRARRSLVRSGPSFVFF